MKHLFILLALIALTMTPLEAQKKKGGGRKKGANPEAPQMLDLAPAKLAGEVAGDRASDPAKQSDWPAIAFSSDGALWTAWVQWDDRNADRIVVRRRDPKGAWGNPIVHRRRQLGPLHARHRGPRHGRRW